MDLSPQLRVAITWAFVLGGVGFAAGFFGPMVLAPESDLGPVIGILFTGPGGAVAGLALGALLAVLPVAEARQRQALVAASAVLAVGTLYASLPEPAVRGYVMDAQVEACARPAQALDAAVTRWERAVARSSRAMPTANWKELASRSVQEDPGVVLTMRITRKSAVLRHRRPWDRGRASVGPWTDVDESRQFYADDAGSDCTAYLARPRALYWPVIDPESHPARPDRIWPPTDTLGFLQLQALGPVPPEYRLALR